MVRPRKDIDVVKVFRAARILTLDQLCRKMGSSRSTVLRRLDEHGYYSSYNHSGKFLTIDEVAEFDSRELWYWNAARFSRQGTLKETAWHFVEDSSQGMTHGELATLLGVRVHNSLLELVEEEWLERERLGPTFVYLSHLSSVRKKQVRQRKVVLKKSKKLRPTHRQIIATLLELIVTLNSASYSTRVTTLLSIISSTLTSSCKLSSVMYTTDSVGWVREMP